jgi:hypothetical protein
LSVVIGADAAGSVRNVGGKPGFGVNASHLHRIVGGADSVRTRAALDALGFVGAVIT